MLLIFRLPFILAQSSLACRFRLPGWKMVIDFSCMSFELDEGRQKDIAKGKGKVSLLGISKVIIPKWVN